MKKIIYTSHALVRRIERDIDEKTIEDIIRQPDYVKATSDEKKTAVKSVEGRIITVIYVEKESHIKRSKKRIGIQQLGTL